MVRDRPRDAAPSSFEIAVLPDAESLALAAADEFARSAAEAVRKRRFFRVALSGGSTPRALYRRLTRAPYRAAISWEHVRFFWGDERCVPPDSKRSNYRMARETLLDPLEIPPRQVFRMKGEEEPEAAARAYERTLCRYAVGRTVGLDLVLLGLGEDGHTASLFPGTAALDAGRRLVAANYVGKFSEWRITLTYRALNAARRIVFVVCGTEKASAVAKVLQKSSGWRELPASGVCPGRGSLLWLLDEAAASRL